MAVGTFTFYNQGRLKIFNGDIDIDGDAIDMVLLGSGYTPDVALHTTYADVSANLSASTDYAPQTVTGIAVTESAGVVTVDSDDVSFGSAVTIEAKYAVFVRKAGASLASTDALLGYVDLNTDSATAVVSSTNSDFIVRTPNGLYTGS